ncbi:hypothetical protein [Aquibium sp. ELW1220]|uniref:hypothetical protein n=1 Tax=Aquibium sp. ELW1220 TaxID=2976766 RepID=UPI0025B1E01D|nr:hypothetical protein [Aquibium sp. ELW1220]MDN2581684.1 hypothetical protein [Aquibium sp. ELW1220]
MAGSPGQSGYALPAVLVFLGIVAAMSAHFAGEARLELDIQRTLHAHATLDALARKIALGFAPSWIEGSSEDAASFSCPARAHSVSVALRKQDRLTDLNAAPADDIAAALGGLGLPPRVTGEVAADIVRFRSYDPHDRFNVERVDIDGGLKRGPFEAVEELADFPALAAIEPSRLRQVFTIQRRMGGGMGDDGAGRYSVEVRAARPDGRAAAFSAIMSFDPVSHTALLIDVFGPAGAPASPGPAARPCPEAAARLVERWSDAVEPFR